MAKSIPFPRQPLTAEDIVDLHIPQEVQVSPAGHRVAYVVKTAGQPRDHDVSAIWIAKVGQQNTARQVTSGLHHDWHVQWAPDNSKRLAFLSDRAGKGLSCSIFMMHREHFSEPILLNPDWTGKPISHLAWSPDGQYIAFSSPDPEAGQDREPDNDSHVHGVDDELYQLRLLNISSKAVTLLYAGPAHVLDFVWRDDSRAIFCSTTRAPTFDSPVDFGVDFVMVDLKDRRSTKLGSFPGPTKGHLQYATNALFFLGGTTPELMSSSIALYELNLETGSYDRRVGGIDSDVVSNTGLKTSGILHVQQGLFDELWCRRRNTAFRLLYSVPQEISCFHAVETTDEKVVIALVQSNAQTPPEIYTFTMPDCQSKPNDEPMQITNHGQHLLSKRLGLSHEVSCQSYDAHVTLRGTIFVPDGYRRASHGALPTLCLIHGGPYGRVNDAFSPRAFGHFWSLYLVSSGRYAVICPNYRGSSSQGDGTACAAHGKLGTIDYDDTLATVEEGIRSGVVDKKKLLVGGWGHGAFLAYLSAVRNGYTEEAGPVDWEYRGAICGAGVTEWDMVNLTSFSMHFGAELVGSAPWKRSRHDVRAREASAVWELRSTDARVPPTLILHPELDKRVPLSQSLAYWRVAQAKKLDVQLVTYPREGHHIRERAHKIDVLKRVLQFCDKCTGQD